MPRRAMALKAVSPEQTSPAEPLQSAIPDDAVSRAAALLARGRPALAAEMLIPALLDAAEAGDRLAAIAADLLRQDLDRHGRADPARARPVPEDTMAEAVERMADLIQRQEDQIAALMLLLDGRA